MALRTLYLQKMLSINGRDSIKGRKLFDRFQQLSEEMLLGYVVFNDEVAATFKDPRLQSDIVSYNILRDFRPNVVFVEGGLFTGNDGTWKIPETIARSICGQVES